MQIRPNNKGGQTSSNNYTQRKKYKFPSPHLINNPAF